jgi:hypothetical protein
MQDNAAGREIWSIDFSLNKAGWQSGSEIIVVY